MRIIDWSSDVCSSDLNDVQINVQSEVVNAELDVMVHPFLDVIFLRVLPTNAKAQHKMTGWLHSLASHDEITKDVRRLPRFSPSCKPAIDADGHVRSAQVRCRSAGGRE